MFKRQSGSAPVYNTSEHRQTRKQWAVLVEAGGVVCSVPGCGRPIVAQKAPRPDGKGGVRMVSNWDLHHPRPYRGVSLPAHASCNRREGAQEGNRRSNALPKKRGPWRKRQMLGPVSTSKSW